ncbi:4-hydroxyphenylacetate 3-monooxygenase, reductase component [Paraburkholderia acidisoli]|uniref:4-hydroxyphenylacetate 3-monooxygenase reductase component n=1 Tax=Paraburkholderia acidisoli TaxID=2571748 RepID=A0A7Z2GRN3_9BURK|nr:4-hydroxyphenylacetate 3-monooxygenase, reductase component [Paraburkholderia acidisoli]QGZ66657.1 4-hydroxyphenylacetate 3-monooxygenase, reductase component [Paraburkholderia acidisoli]
MTHDEDRLRFREAMASLAAAVNVITTDGPRGRCGITASAVCPVTDSPPTMLVCINRASHAHDVLRENENVCINVLGARDQELARVFAGMTGCTMDERFARCAWTRGALDVPLLAGAIANLEGTMCESKEVGSHSVFFVRIAQIVLRDEADSLVYFRRRFHRVSPGELLCEAP